jgi:UPF0176 protein
MTTSPYQVLLYYKYTEITQPDKLRESQMELARSLGLKGRVIISPEGINGTLEGLAENIDIYCSHLIKEPGFEDIHLKKSEGSGASFPKLSIKVREEIVSSHVKDISLDPTKITGKHITAETLHEWIHSDKEFYIVDMRNDYEQTVGYFENSILSQFTNFRDLPSILPKIEHLKNKTVVTVCTGGVRCEKASGFLLEHGFSDVYQLYGGIVTYMEKYPNQDFLGKLYVFDKRIVMGFNTDHKNHIKVGKCEKCGATSENFVNCSNLDCHKHFICCEDCSEEDGTAFCDLDCKNHFMEKLAV